MSQVQTAWIGRAGHIPWAPSFSGPCPMRLLLIGTCGRAGVPTSDVTATLERSEVEFHRPQPTSMSQFRRTCEEFEYRGDMCIVSDENI
jgi:hypothetical protein